MYIVEATRYIKHIIADNVWREMCLRKLTQEVIFGF